MKKKYLDLMEKALEAYGYAHIVRYFDDVKRYGLKEHGFARLTSNIGIMLANGRKSELTDIFLRMMDFCCETMPVVKAANDFTVKEIIFCILALEDAGLMKEKTAYWRECLKGVTPEKTYNIYAKQPTDKVHNWACFSMLSEFMRQYIGIAETSEFVDLQIASQLQFIEENGMYRDPNDPMVYDLVPRGLFAVLLAFGYRGKYYEEIDGILRRAGLLTLKMQSVSGEIPYGGRSNQFMHNEAHLAIVFEYEARRYAAEGNTDLAARFKLGVKKALDNIEWWFSKDPIRHVKNRYPTETKFGCEDYAYFDKYMITAGSFLYAALLICDENIPCADSEDLTPYTAETSVHFHKLFASGGGYFAEFDTAADHHYECSGLGRIHKLGAPSTVCMSLPCSSEPNFVTDVQDRSDISMCAGTVRNGEFSFATGNAANYRVISRSADSDHAYCSMECTVSGAVLRSDYSVGADGVEITVSGEGEIAFMLPAFEFDGEVSPGITASKHTLSVDYLGYRCLYETDGNIIDTGKRGCNRNGRYKAFATVGSGSLKIKVTIEKMA